MLTKILQFNMQRRVTNASLKFEKISALKKHTIVLYIFR